jgi:hypothetical protein
MSYLLGITEPSASPANRGGLAILAAARSASESVSSCTWPSKQERLKLFNSLDDKQQRQLKDQLAVHRDERAGKEVVAVKDLKIGHASEKR